MTTTLSPYTTTLSPTTPEGIKFDDWFLPSIDELSEMYNVIYIDPAHNLGNFAWSFYWSSTEDIVDYGGNALAWYRDFDYVTTPTTDAKSGLQSVRAIRKFTSTINYNLCDIGPAGGWIFWKNGNDYLEAAPYDQAINDAKYSNILIIIGVSAQGTAIVTGQANTLAIIGQAGHVNSAAKLCADLVIYNIPPTTTWGPTTSLIPTSTLKTTTGISVTTAEPLMRGVTISHKLPDRITSTDLIPYVTFVVNPGLGDCYEFLDMFINTTYQPTSVIVATDKDFTDPAIVLMSKIKKYNDGWYYIRRLPKTIGVGVLRNEDGMPLLNEDGSLILTGGIGGIPKVLIGKVLFVKIFFDSQALFYDLKLVKTGYKSLIEG